MWGSWWPVGHHQRPAGLGNDWSSGAPHRLTAVGHPGVIVALPPSGKQGRDVADSEVVSCPYEATEAPAAAVRPPARTPPLGTPFGRRGDRQGRRPPRRGPRGADRRDRRSGRVDGCGPHRGRGVHRGRSVRAPVQRRTRGTRGRIPPAAPRSVPHVRVGPLGGCDEPIHGRPGRPLRAGDGASQGGRLGRRGPGRGLRGRRAADRSPKRRRSPRVPRRAARAAARRAGRRGADHPPGHPSRTRAERRVPGPGRRDGP